MADDGSLILRIYRFDPQAFVGATALHLPEHGDMPTAVYSSDLSIEETSVSYNPWDGTGWKYVTAFTWYWWPNQDEAPGPGEPIEVVFTMVKDGMIQPIDPFDPPPLIHMQFSNNYAAGVYEIGTYIGGQFVVMWQKEVTSDDFHGKWDIALDPAEIPPIPPFWTGLQRTQEII